MYRDIENWYKLSFKDEGEYGIPCMEPEYIDTEFIEAGQFIPFNCAQSCKHPEENGVHFFVHDYQFRRLWDLPERYMQMLRRFAYVCTPDYSLYADIPKAMQIFHHYKKQWMGAYWQANGLNVVPTVSWSDQESFSWCFDSLPKGGAVAVSSVGCLKSESSRKAFMLGYQKMISTVKPEQILFYGTIPEEIKGKVIQIRSFQEKFNGL